MTTYVAFLRAINLGTRRRFPKDAIRAAVEAAGMSEVETYINTGNVRVTTPLRSRAKVEAALEKAFRAAAGFDVPTIVFTPEVEVVHEGGVSTGRSRRALLMHSDSIYRYYRKHRAGGWRRLTLPAAWLLLRLRAEAAWLRVRVAGG